jgi:hypothetical protein
MTEIDLARNSSVLTSDKFFEDHIYENMPVIEELWGTPDFNEIDMLLKAWLGEGVPPESASTESTRYGTSSHQTVSQAVSSGHNFSGNYTDEDIPF